MAKHITVKKINTKSLKGQLTFELKNSIYVFQYTVDSVNSFYAVYQEHRKGSKGSSTHREQDLLRAMLVFACSGLDAVVKQLIKDSLIKVIDTDKSGGAREEFRKFVERRMKKVSGNTEDELFRFDINFLSQIITSIEPRKELLIVLQKSLCSDSLQSRDQLLKVAAHFAITMAEILENPDLTKVAFDIRNDIIHQMDVDFSASKQGTKKRKMRSASDMIKYTKNILDIGTCFINSVYKKINGTT